MAIEYYDESDEGCSRKDWTRWLTRTRDEAAVPIPLKPDRLVVRGRTMARLKHKLKEFSWKISVISPDWTMLFIQIFFFCSLARIAYKLFTGTLWG